MRPILASEPSTPQVYQKASYSTLNLHNSIYSKIYNISEKSRNVVTYVFNLLLSLILIQENLHYSLFAILFPYFLNPQPNEKEKKEKKTNKSGRKPGKTHSSRCR